MFSLTGKVVTFIAIVRENWSMNVASGGQSLELMEL